MNSNYPLAAAMINQINRVDMISNNLANANTNGFKQEVMVEGTFNNYLNKIHDHSPLVAELSTLMNNVPKLDGKFANEELGPIALTGNKLDYALKHNDTFFKIQGNDDEILYTRDGAFKIVDNILVTSNNQPVLNADDEPVVIEEGEDFSALIGVVRTNFENIEKFGQNNYRAINVEEVENLADDNTQYIVNGSLEKSNVNMVNTMVSLIDAHRRLENAQKAMYSLSDMSSTLLEKIASEK